MKTRFQNSRKRSFSPPGRSSAVPQSRPRSRYSSLHGPHGPVGPACQKFSELGHGTIRSRGTPTPCHSSIASSSGPSPSCVVAFVDRDPDFCGSKPKTSSAAVHANSIAPALKYSPTEKLPSISKNVRWRVVVPMMSMSTLRKHFWQLVRSDAGGASWPRKYGFSGCIPAVVSRTEGSNEAGTSEPDGRRRWPRCSKNSMKFLRISSEVIMRKFVSLGGFVWAFRVRRPSVGGTPGLIRRWWRGRRSTSPSSRTAAWPGAAPRIGRSRNAVSLWRRPGSLAER